VYALDNYDPYKYMETSSGIGDILTSGVIVVFYECISRSDMGWGYLVAFYYESEWNEELSS